jgi:hypothetical protein
MFAQYSYVPARFIQQTGKLTARDLEGLGLSHMDAATVIQAAVAFPASLAA